MSYFHIDSKTHALLKKERTAIDRAMIFIGTVGPLATIPQAFMIYSTKSAVGVSVLSWLLYLAISVFSLLYAIVHGLRALIVSNILWIIVDTVIVVGCIVYK